MHIIHPGILGQADHDRAMTEPWGTFYFFTFLFFKNPVLKVKLKIQVQHLGGDETGTVCPSSLDPT